MEQSIGNSLKKEIRTFFQLRKTERLWHIPLLASICVGIPLLLGWYFNQLQASTISTMASLVILYLPGTGLAHRMITMLACSFGFIFCFATGLFFSFNPIIAALVVGLVSVGIHWVNLYFKAGPPGCFFFIMLAATASAMPHQPELMPYKIGMVSMGTMLACMLALGYSLVVIKRYPPKQDNTIAVIVKKDSYANLVEACIMGTFMCLSLLLGYFLHLKNPTWILISCAAIMQGTTLYHVRQRMAYRIIGTMLGAGICWLLLLVLKAPLSICISIMVLQFIIEMLVVRHYALAVIFITPLTILLAELANPAGQQPDELMKIRFLNIAIGSIMGAIGGWLIHHQQLRQLAVNKLRQTDIMLKRKAGRK